MFEFVIEDQVVVGEFDFEAEVEHGAGVGGFEFAEGKVVGGDYGYSVEGDQFFGQSARACVNCSGTDYKSAPACVCSKTDNLRPYFSRQP
jgi:hypothetical protein